MYTPARWKNSLQSPKDQGCASHWRPDATYGEELMAWIQTVDGEPLTADDVRGFCTGKIAHFKIPRYVQVIDAFPMTVTGKIQKFKLREMAQGLVAGGAPRATTEKDEAPRSG